MNGHNIIAENFVHSNEFVERFGDNLSARDFLKTLYQNVLGREPDNTGYEFWLKEFERGQSEIDILVAFTMSTENSEKNAVSFGLLQKQLLDHLAQASDLPPGFGGVLNNPSKIGIGTWETDGNGTSLAHIQALNFGWYYNWLPTPLWSTGANQQDVEFVPMIWGAKDATPGILSSISNSPFDFLLAFNEPHHVDQANLSVKAAIELWPALMQTGKLLGSPATTNSETSLGPNSWLGRFMSATEFNNYDVDFIAVHYYSDNPDVGLFEAFLSDIYNEYGKVIWVTEWALVDWDNPDRFSLEETAAFARDGILMMDELAFVEKHAWFAPYTGGDGWHINAEIFDENGRLTPAGNVFAEFLHPNDGLDLVGITTGIHDLM